MHLCECLGIIHFNTGPFYECTSVLCVLTANRLPAIFSNWFLSGVISLQAFPFVAPTQVAVYNIQWVIHCTIEIMVVSSILFGGDALICCVSVSSAVWAQFKTDQVVIWWLSWPGTLYVLYTLICPQLRLLHSSGDRGSRWITQGEHKLESRITTANKAINFWELDTQHHHLHHHHFHLHHSSWQWHRDLRRTLDGGSGREAWDPLGVEAAAVHRRLFQIILAVKSGSPGLM